MNAAIMTRPHVTLKLATSLDGRIATASGESKWITSPEARAEVQRLRAATQAVIVGAGTARADDPELLARTEPPPQRQPLRVVVDTEFSLKPTARLFANFDRGRVLIIGALDADAAARAGLERAGAQTAAVARGPVGIDAEAALEHLAAEGIERVLVEGGGVLAASLLAADAVDRLEWFRAPIILGGDGRPAVAALGLTKLAEASAWRRIALRELGPDLWESYERVS